MTTAGAWNLGSELATPQDRLKSLLGDVTEPRRVIDLSSAVPNWSMPDPCASSLRQLQGWSANAPVQGIPELIHSLKAWMSSSFALELDEVRGEVIPTVGSREGLASAMAMALHRSQTGKRVVIVPEGSYHAVQGAVRCANGVVHDLEMAHGRRLSDAILSLDGDVLDNAAAIVFPFPAGHTAPSEMIDGLTAVLELAQNHDAMVIADECMLELYEELRPTSFFDVVREWVISQIALWCRRRYPSAHL